MDSSTIYKAPGKKTEDTPVCIITGCSAGGLGFSLTRALLTKSNSLSRSWIVIATVRDQKSLKTLQTLSINLPPHSVLVPYFLDITDRHSVSTFVRQVIHQYRRIDLLINNAATSLQGSIVELSMTGFRAVWETNVIGTVNMIQEVVPYMSGERFINNNTSSSGQIINIGSIVGFLPTPLSGAYCASKAAIASLTTTLRMELKKRNVHVSLLIPCGATTNIHANAEKLEKNIINAMTQQQRYSSTSLKSLQVVTNNNSSMSPPTPPRRSTMIKQQSSSPPPPPPSTATATSSIPTTRRTSSLLSPPFTSPVAPAAEPTTSDHEKPSLPPLGPNDYIALSVISILDFTTKTNSNGTTRLLLKPLPPTIWAAPNLFWRLVMWIFYICLFLPSSMIENGLAAKFEE